VGPFLSNFPCKENGPGTRLAVTRLSPTKDLEIVDIDVMADKNKVLEALRLAVPGSEDDAAALAARYEITVIGIWAVRLGQQMATVRVPASVVSLNNRVQIGWVMCQVRDRRPE